jgi:hypothetical protein
MAEPIVRDSVARRHGIRRLHCVSLASRLGSALADEHVGRSGIRIVESVSRLSSTTISFVQQLSSQARTPNWWLLEVSRKG